jgi:hypothetical protein
VRFPTRPSRKAVRNHLAFLAGETQMEQAPNGGKRGKQPEGETNKAIAAWRNLKPGLVLERNKRRLATPPGMTQPIMLGWMADGSPDWIGYLPITITESMVGTRIAVFVGLEAKRGDDVAPRLSADQRAFLNALKDAGGVAGVVRNAADAEDAIERWRNER